MTKLAMWRVGITTISGLALATGVSCGSGRGSPEYLRLASRGGCHPTWAA
jgi:hypothetical protein